MKTITISELTELQKLNISIHVHWIGLLEGYEYSACLMGDWDHKIAYAKSMRALYNRCKKWAAQQAAQADGANAAPSDKP